jgi:hypothetical protein
VLAFALACVGIYTLMSAFVGARLIRRALPSRAVPELLMGTAYLSAPGFGYPLAVIGSSFETHAVGLAMLCVGQGLIVFGCSCFFFFNARVFRPKSMLAPAGAAVGSILFALSALEISRGHIALGHDALGLVSVRAASVTMLGVLGLAYAWTAFEGFRHNRMMRRRARVGLGDPVVANRFLLWAIAGSLQVLADAVSAWALHGGADITTDLGSVLATSLVGIVNSALLVLIFIPPPRYTRWLVREPQGALATV